MGTTAQEQRPVTTLVADDVTINLDIIEAILCDLGHTVTLVKSGEEAIIAWQQGDGVFDFIFMDIEMPFLGGMKSARIIRKLEMSQGRKRTPIIAMTAYALEEAVAQYRATGFDGYIDKPFNKSNIRSVLDQLKVTFHPDNQTSAVPSTRTEVSPGSTTVEPRKIFNRPELVVRCGDQDEQIAEYISMFIEDIDAHLPALEAAINGDDLAAATRHIHSIKGVTGNICADRMYEISILMHISVRGGDLTNLKKLTGTLKSEYERFKSVTTSHDGTSISGTGGK